MAFDLDRGTDINPADAPIKLFEPEVQLPDNTFHPLFMDEDENVSEKEEKALSLVVITLFLELLFITRSNYPLYQIVAE